MKYPSILVAMFLLIVAGCTPHSYIELVSKQTDIVPAGKTYEYQFFIKNPNDITFTGIIEYSYDKRCLQPQPYTYNDTVGIWLWL